MNNPAGPDSEDKTLFPIYINEDIASASQSVVCSGCLHMEDLSPTTYSIYTCPTEHAGALDDVCHFKSKEEPGTWRTFYMSLKHKDRFSICNQLNGQIQGDFSLTSYFKSEGNMLECLTAKGGKFSSLFYSQQNALGIRAAAKEKHDKFSWSTHVATTGTACCIAQLGELIWNVCNYLLRLAESST